MGNNTNTWTNNEDNILKENYQHLSDSKLTELLPGRTKNAIYSRRHELGLTKQKTKLSFDEVMNLFNERGYTLLSNPSEYSGVTSKLRYICSHHKDQGEQKIDLSHLLQGRGCYYCGRERTISAKRIQIDKKNDKEIVESKGLKYIDTRRQNGILIIDYVCSKHEEIGIQTMQRNYMLKHAIGCPYCHGHSLPEWYVMKKIKEINPNIELLEPYENMTKRIKCRCKKHDYISTKSVQDILKGSGCKYCGIEKLSEKSYLSDKEVQDRVVARHPHIKLIKYCGANDKASEWYCEKHHQFFKKVYSKLLTTEHSGCKLCYQEHMKNLCGLTFDEFSQRLHNIHPDLEIISEYKGLNHPIKIHCNKHDYTYVTTGACILRRKNCCPKSFKTYKEESMCTLIESWGYRIIRQHYFKNCIDKYPLKFDCFLVDFNTVVEYDGEQHFFPVKFGTQSEDDAKRKFEYTKYHDEIKNKYCFDNNINIIRVPYYHFDDMEYFLFDQFSKLNIIIENKVS